MTVDDSNCIRKSARYFLEDSGYEVIEAEDGIDALNKITFHPIDMVITDINMPNLDGINLIREIRKVPGKQFIPIIVLTTESVSGKGEEAKAAGATAWITKPFKPEKMIEVIKRLLK